MPSISSQCLSCRESFLSKNARKSVAYGDAGVFPKYFPISLVLLDVGPPQSTGDVGVLFDVLAGREDGPQLAEEGAVVAVVQLAELGRDGVGSLLGPVKGNATGRIHVSACC